MSTPRTLAVATITAAALGLTLAPTAAAATFTPGAEGAGDPYFPLAGNGGYDVQHYDLRLAYDPKSRSLQATAILTLRTTQDLSSFNLDLYGLTVVSVSVDGAAATFRQEGQEVVATPSTGLAAGRTVQVEVLYGGKPGPYTDPDGSIEGFVPTKDGAFVVGEPVGSMTWFPNNNTPADKATYRIAVTVPRQLEALATGVLVSRTTERNTITWTWQQDQPVSTYLTTATIGNFKLDTSTTPSGIPNYLAVDQSLGGSAWTAIRQTEHITEWGIDQFGPYPFSATGGIVDDAPEVGYALETATKPVYDSPPSVSTVVHEIAHQWYGNSVTPRYWRDIWLNEGFASWSEWFYAEQHGGPTAAQELRTQYNAIAADDPFWAEPVLDPGAAGIFGEQVYLRGAMTLQALRETIGEAAFTELLRRWASDYRYSAVETSDFIELAEQVGGQDLGGFFDAWLVKPERPALPA